jgi:hypothetical protein
MIPDLTSFKYARMMQEVQKAGVTVEDIANALALLNGDDFDAEKNKPVLERVAYNMYMADAELIIALAIDCAKDRAP